MELAKLKSIHLSDKDFSRLQYLIKNHCGIRMTSNKKTMIQARLQKRGRNLGIDTITEYCDYLFSHEGMKNELIHMIDAITTNKTDFFRESTHFDILVKNVLPDIIQDKIWSVNKPLRVWSAGCSTGEEPYTLAMVLSEFAANQKNFRFSILATDISTKVLDEAKLGIYNIDRIDPVPFEMKVKYLLRSRDRRKGLVRIIPELRKYVKFQRLNLLEEDYTISERMDIVFLRNVLIYFDRLTHEKILNRLSRYLNYDGYLFIGHAETLNGLDVPFIQVMPTIYKKSSIK
ncbi:MAG: protein-glutamate O-methyltransferase [Nitrospirae bacterium]|nr:protein-glutamate O-methyltransferase [Nitrospirota bacterium]